MQKRIIIALILTLTFPSLHLAESAGYNRQAAATYYVAPLGNDSNPGTPSQPWAHSPGMPGWSGSVTLQAGDTVYFYNTGAWESATGSAVLQVQAGVTYDGRSWGPGTRAKLRATAALSRSVINLMEDHPSLPTVVRGFEVDANGLETSGIAVNWPQADGDMTGAMKRIEDCVVHDVFSASASGSYEYGIVVSSGWGGNRHVSNIEILNCEVYAISRGGVNIYAANDDPASGISNVLVRGCDIYGTGLDPNYAGSALVAKNHAVNVIFEYNNVHDQVRGVGVSVSTHTDSFYGPENLVIRHNLIANSPHAGIYVQGSGNISLEIYGNLILNNYYEGLNLTGQLTGSLSARVYNNTFYHNYAISWGSDVRVYDSSVAVSALEFTNNLIYTSAAVANTRSLLDTGGKITQHAHNLYYRPGGGTLVLAGSTNYTAANLTTWEATARAVDPVFKNPAALPADFTGVFGVDLRPNTEGFNLTEASAARDSGAALAGTYNRSINSVTRPSGAGWDIGAYEFQPSLELYGAAADRAIRLNWTVDVTLPVTTTWTIDYAGPGGAEPPITGLANATRAYTLSGLTNYAWYTVTLTAVGPDPGLSDTVRVMPTDRFIYFPAIRK